MCLVLDAFAGSWDTAGMTLCQISDSRPINSMVRQRQLRLYGHVARYPKADPAYRVISIRNNPEAKGTPTELLDAASRCLLLGVTQYRKGACMENHKA